MKLITLIAVSLAATFAYVENATHAMKVSRITGAPYFQVLGPVTRLMPVQVIDDNDGEVFAGQQN